MGANLYVRAPPYWECCLKRTAGWCVVNYRGWTCSSGHRHSRRTCPINRFAARRLPTLHLSCLSVGGLITALLTPLHMRTHTLHTQCPIACLFPKTPWPWSGTEELAN